MGNKPTKKSDTYTNKQRTKLTSNQIQDGIPFTTNSTHSNYIDFTKFAKEEQLLLMQLTNSLLSNKISSNDIIQLLKNVEPCGPRWLLYQCQQLMNVHITMDIAIIITDYASPTEIYTLQTPYMIPNNASLYNLYPTQLSISFWCKPQELNRYQTILTTEPLSSNPRTYGWGFRFRREGVFWFNIMTGHGYGSVCCQSKTCLTNKTVNKWYHICGIYNGINGEVKIYVNGILENTGNVDNTQYPLHFTAQNGLQIGSLINNGEKFNGLIADVVIYDKLLSDDEIKMNCKTFVANQNNEQTNIILQSMDLIHWMYVNNGKQKVWMPNIEQRTVECDDIFV